MWIITERSIGIVIILAWLPDLLIFLSERLAYNVKLPWGGIDSAHIFYPWADSNHFTNLYTQHTEYLLVLTTYNFIINKLIYLNKNKFQFSDFLFMWFMEVNLKFWVKSINQTFTKEDLKKVNWQVKLTQRGRGNLLKHFG